MILLSSTTLRKYDHNFDKDSGMIVIITECINVINIHVNDSFPIQ